MSKLGRFNFPAWSVGVALPGTDDDSAEKEEPMMGTFIASRGTKFGVFNNQGQVGPWYDSMTAAIAAAAAARPPLLFTLGQCVSTPGALAAIEKNNTFPIVFLRRHQTGDWGDLGAEDKARNDAALVDESRIFSAYNLPDGQRIWVITEAVNDDGERASTCILLPSEY